MIVLLLNPARVMYLTDNSPTYTYNQVFVSSFTKMYI